MQWTEAHAQAMDDEMRKADPRKVDEWLRELDARGQVVFGVSVVKVLLLAVGSWVFVFLLVGALLTMDRADWILFTDPSRTAAGIGQLVFGVVIFGGGLFVFGAGAVLSTFVVPVARPRTVVTPRDVRHVWTVLGGERVVFRSLWQDVVAVRVHHFHTKWPLPERLNLSIEARTAVTGDTEDGIQAAGSSSRAVAAPGGATVTGPVASMPRQRKRDILSFLVAVHERTMGAGRV